MKIKIKEIKIELKWWLIVIIIIVVALLIQGNDELLNQLINKL